MVDFLAKRVTDTLIKNHAAEESQRMVVIFGVEAIINKILHLGAMLIISLLFGKMPEIILFHLFYQVIRTYAGGHHAKSNIVCFICSCGIAVGILVFWSLCPMAYKTLCTIVFLAVSVPIIWFLAPVAATNKPLDEAETAIYRKKARFYLMIETAIVIVLLLFGLGEMALVGTTALVVLAIMLLLGEMKVRRIPMV